MDILPGSFLFLALWSLIAAAFGYFIGHDFGYYESIHGLLYGVILLLLSAYLVAFTLLLGGELNANLAKEIIAGGHPEQMSDSEETMAMWKITLSLIVAVGFVSGCAEPPDELTPYVTKFEGMQKYNEKLSRYQVYLSNPGLERQARDVRQILQAYHDDMDKLDSTNDKFITATHNLIKRALARGLKKIVEPDFPTFTVSASKQIRNIRAEVEDHYANLERLWTEAGKTDPFPLKWPASGE